MSTATTDTELDAVTAWEYPVSYGMSAWPPEHAPCSVLVTHNAPDPH